MPLPCPRHRTGLIQTVGHLPQTQDILRERLIGSERGQFGSKHEVRAFVEIEIKFVGLPEGTDERLGKVKGPRCCGDDRVVQGQGTEGARVERKLGESADASQRVDEARRQLKFGLRPAGQSLEELPSPRCCSRYRRVDRGPRRFSCVRAYIGEAVRFDIAVPI